MDGVLKLLSVTLLCLYYSLIVALVSVPVLSKFLSVCIWWVLLPRYFPVVRLGASKQMGIENLHSISRYCHLTDLLGGVMYVCMNECMYVCTYVLWILWTASCVWFFVVVVSSVDKIEETTLPIIPARRVNEKWVLS
jgi:hypothetical protein